MISLLLPLIYISFISLGLPDALLGAAWPVMYEEFGVSVSAAGIVSMIVSGSTVISSLLSDRMTKRLGPGKVTAFSVALTAAAIIGFSVSNSFIMLCILALPYGLGAGGVDAALNNYVAIHYESKHMSWLHAMWGLGISVGPYIMGFALSKGMTWNKGYLIIAVFQIILTAVLVFSLPVWKKAESERMNRGEADGGNEEGISSENTDKSNKKLNEDLRKELKTPLSLKETVGISGAKNIMLTFFCYCSLEQTAILWGSTYLVMGQGMKEEKAASLASLFCIGITVGRFLSGFLAMKMKNHSIVRLGQGIIIAGIICMFIPFNINIILAGLVLIGLGCAPIYPCVMHSTPMYFGADKSQAVIGVQMASAYVGSSIMPMIFGGLVGIFGIKLLPIYLLVLLVVMLIAHEGLVKKCLK